MFNIKLYISTKIKWKILFILSLFALLVCLSVTSQNITANNLRPNTTNRPEVKNILLLSSWANHLPWSRSLLNGIERELTKQTEDTVNLFTEYLDYSRLGKPMSDRDLAEFLNKKYHQIHLDGVIVDSNIAVRFIQENGFSIFGDIPYVMYSNISIDGDLFSNYAVIQLLPAVEKTVQLAMMQNANTEKVIFIGDRNAQRQELLQQVSRAVKAQNPEIEIIVKDNFMVDELEQELSTLPDRSLIIYSLVFQDKSGQSWRPVDVVERLAASASAPIYVFYDSLIGSGVVGGYVQKAEKTGEVAVRAIYDLIRNQQIGNNVNLEYEVTGTVLDWRALRKWNIPLSLVPKDAEIRYRKPFVWEVYLKETIIAISVILIQSVSVVTITILFLQRRRLSQDLLSLTQQLEMRVVERTQQLYVLATQDDLTGISNRKKFYEQANAEFDRFKHDGCLFTLAIFDIDRFKSINDTYGHIGGDKVLQDFAQEIADLIRKNDIWGRVGGEEFMLILPETNLQHGLIVLERIRRYIQDFQFVLSDSQVISATVSIGATESRITDGGLEDLIREADHRLYLAKKNGRNQVVYKDKI